MTMTVEQWRDVTWQELEKLRQDKVEWAGTKRDTNLPLPSPGQQTAGNKYSKECPYSQIDVYRVLELFNVTDPAVAHAIKKLLCAGQRGVKSYDQDIHEALKSLLRWKQMREEDGTYF